MGHDTIARKRALRGAGLMLAACGYARLARPRLARWGATGGEVAGAGASDGGGRHGTMSPVVVEAEADISRPPEQVFDYCCDPRPQAGMEPHDESQQEDRRRPLGVGARYATEFVKGPPMVMECVAYERPSAWSLAGRSSALQAGGGGRVLPAADGSHLTMRKELEPRGLLRVAAPLLRRRMKPMLERDLASIKSVLEGRPGSRTASVA